MNIFFQFFYVYNIIMNIIILSFIIYTYHFINLNNTIFRINHLGDKVFNIIPLFTEGFIGPIRSFIYLLVFDSFKNSLYYFYCELFRLSNPYSALLFVFYIKKIFLTNI